MIVSEEVVLCRIEQHKFINHDPSLQSISGGTKQPPSSSPLDSNKPTKTTTTPKTSKTPKTPKTSKTSKTPKTSRTKCNFIKYMLFFFNFIIWLAGCVILGVSLWLHHDQKTSRLLDLQYEGAEAPNTSYISVYIVIAVGAVMMFVGFLGCCAIRESQCLLRTFFVCLVILLVCAVAAGILGFSQPDWKIHLIGIAALVVAVLVIFEMIFSMVLCCGIRNSVGVASGRVLHPPAPAQHSTAPAKHSTAPAQHSTAPAKHSTAPAQHNTAPAQHNTAPAQHSIAPAQHNTAPAQHSIAPAQHSIAPAQYSIAPAQHNTAPAQHSIALAQYSPALVQYSPALAQHSPALAQHSPALAQYSPAIAQYSTAIAQYSTTPAHSPMIISKLNPHPPGPVNILPVTHLCL